MHLRQVAMVQEAVKEAVRDPMREEVLRREWSDNSLGEIGNIIGISAPLATPPRAASLLASRRAAAWRGPQSAPRPAWPKRKCCSVLVCSRCDGHHHGGARIRLERPHLPGRWRVNRGSSHGPPETMV